MPLVGNQTDLYSSLATTTQTNAKNHSRDIVAIPGDPRQLVQICRRLEATTCNM